MEEDCQYCEDVRDQRLDTEVVTIEVVTMVDVEINVVVAEDVDKEPVVDVRGIPVDEDVDEELVVDTVVVSVVVVDEVASVVVDVDSVDVAKDVEVEITVVVGIEEVVDSVDITGLVEDKTTVVVGMEVVDTADGVVDTVVTVELSIGKYLTAFTAVILEITPGTARKRISVNAIRTATDFIQLSLLPQNRMARFLPRACEHRHRCSLLTTGCSSI